MSLHTLHTPGFELPSPDAGNYTPNLDYRFMIGSQVVALVGPPAVGRRQIIASAAELFPDDITPLARPHLPENRPLDDTEHQTALQVVGVVAEPFLWFHRMTQRYPAGNPERAAQRQESLDCLAWLNRYSEDLHILYNVDRKPEVTAARLHAYLTEGHGDSTEAIKVLPNLQLAAETMGV